MDYRQLGGSGLRVPLLGFGSVTFGGQNSWGNTEVAEATRLIDVALDAGVNLFDSADVYSGGRAEEILGQAIGKRRHEVLLATKAGFRSETGPNGLGASRHHLIRACEASLRRLGTDYIDLYQLHSFDAITPVEETLRALDDLVHTGKVRYVGCSNFSGWHLMKSLAAAERHGLPRYVAHQAYYSLLGRDYEWELLPLALDQQVGTIVWSPLAGGRLAGRMRRDQPLPADSRIGIGAAGGAPVDDERIYRVVAVLDELASETGKTVAQIALNWLLQRPTVAMAIVGARNEQQLRENLGAVGWTLTTAQIARLDAVSDTTPPYPYWHQRKTSAARNPPATGG